jgi:hypothetical protein
VDSGQEVSVEVLVKVMDFQASWPTVYMASLVKRRTLCSPVFFGPVLTVVASRDPAFLVAAPRDSVVTVPSARPAAPNIYSETAASAFIDTAVAAAFEKCDFNPSL